MNDIVRKDFLFKEIEIIQSIIRRMAFNSFLIKGWTLTLVIASLLINNNFEEKWLGFIPLVIFWFLDTYYLRQEKLFRKLHNWTKNNRLQTNELFFDTDVEERFGEKVKFCKVLRSKTIAPFYLSIGVLVLVYILIKEGIL